MVPCAELDGMSMMLTLENAAEGKQHRKREHRYREKALSWFFRNLPVLSFGVLLFVARYALADQFGLYEDDLSRIPGAMAESLGNILRHLQYWVFHFRGQGRPLHEAFILLFGYLGGRFSSLQVLYLLGFLLAWLNAALLYRLIRSAASDAFAYILVFGWILFLADTTHVFLTHALGVQPAFTLYLLAALALLRDKPFLGYALGALSLITYETFFLLLLPIPLLLQPISLKKWKLYLRHVIVLGAILVADFALRIYVGESRIAGLGLRQLLITPLDHSLRGPLYGLSAYVYRPIEVLQGFSPTQGLQLVVLSGGYFLVLSLLFSHTFPQAFEETFVVLDAPFRWKRVREEWYLLLLGFAFLVLAYPLTFTVDPANLTGRASRVHLAGAFGAAMVFAGCLLLFIRRYSRGAYRHGVLGVISVWLSLLTLFSISVQTEYARAWALQRRFWSSLVYQIQDVGEGDVLLVDPGGLIDTAQIGANTWNVPRVLPQLFTFPETWVYPPMAYRVIGGAWEEILGEGTSITLNRQVILTPNDTLHPADADDVKVFSSENGFLHRMDYRPGQGYTSSELDMEQALPPFTTTLLFRLMVLDE